MWNMTGKPIHYTNHAATVMSERNISSAWVEKAVHNPGWVEGEPTDVAIERRFCNIAENGNRILRVVCLENSVEIRIISVFFDRKARKPK